MNITIQRSRFLAGGLGAGTTLGLLRYRGDAAQFEYKFSHAFTVDHPFHARAVEMWTAVRDETSGRLSVLTFPNSQLGNDTAVFGQMRAGAVQFAAEAPALIGTVVPAAAISNVGFAFRSAADGLAALDGALGDYVRAQLVANAIFPFPAVYDVGMREIVARPRPVLKADDFSGLKIRCQESKIDLDLFRTLGASPTPLPFNEIYTALQNRLIDGADAALGVVDTSRYFEVAKYVSLTNHTWVGYWILGNAASFAALPADVQAIVVRNNRKFALLERKDVATLNGSTKSTLQAKGMVFNDVDPGSLRSKLAPYYARWRAEFGDTAWALLEKMSGKLG